MSQPSWKRPLALATILFILGSFSYWLVYKHKPEQEERSELAKKIVNLDHTQVRSVLISGQKTPVSLECQDLGKKMCKPGDNSNWEITSPLKIKADDSNANSLISTINALNASDTISLKEETPKKRAALLKEYGLDPDSLSKDRKLEVTTTDGTTVVYLGVTHPIGEGIFSAVEHVQGMQAPTGKIDENEVYILPSYFKGSFDRDLTYWRDKKVLPLSSHEIEAFTLKDSKGEIRGVRNDGVWTLRSKKEEVTGDQEAMDSLFTGATYLVAKNFLAENKHDKSGRKALSGARPVVTFSLKKEGQAQPIVLTLYKKSGKRLAKGVVQERFLATVSTLDPVFEVESYAKERLDKSIQDLRLSKLITSMDRFSAKRLEFSGSGYGTAPEILLNKDSRWEIQGDPKTKVNGQEIQNFLDHLTASKIQTFVTKNLPKDSANPPGALTFVLGDDSQPIKKKLVFWREVGKLGQKLYAKDLLSKRKEVFLMDNTLSSEIPWNKAKLQ